jgi:uncharacterized protein YigA (DUF484 family)
MSHNDELKRINEIIALRFAKIESAVESAGTIAGLFENLLDGVEKEFSVPFVWISLGNAESAAPVIADVRLSESLKNRFSVVSQELLESVLAGGMKPVLANRDLQPFYRMLPTSRKYFVRSIAVVPFALNGLMIGTWNNGDSDVDRYEPDMKTDLIESLARRVSRKLTELVADKNGASREGSEGEKPGGLYD